MPQSSLVSGPRFYRWVLTSIASSVEIINPCNTRIIDELDIFVYPMASLTFVVVNECLNVIARQRRIATVEVIDTVSVAVQAYDHWECNLRISKPDGTPAVGYPHGDVVSDVRRHKRIGTSLHLAPIFSC